MIISRKTVSIISKEECYVFANKIDLLISYFLDIKRHSESFDTEIETTKCVHLYVNQNLTFCRRFSQKRPQKLKKIKNYCKFISFVQQSLLPFFLNLQKKQNFPTMF